MAIAARAPGLGLDGEDPAAMPEPVTGMVTQAEESGTDRAESALPPQSFEQPEIIEASGDLRLASFFAPRLWLLSLIPLCFSAIISTLSMIRIGERIYALHGGMLYEDVFFQAPSLPFFLRHLLPFGLPANLAMPMGMDSQFGQGMTQWFLQSSPIFGAAALLIGFLVLIAITRNSNDGVYACGPYAVYSLIAILLGRQTGLFYDGLGAIFPALLGGLLMPILVATIAKVVAIAMRNAGMFEIDQDQYTDIEGDTLRMATAGAGASGAVASPPAAGSMHAETGAGSDPAAQSERRQIEQALVCPYCGNSKINHEHPGLCSSCHHNLALSFELLHAPACPSCSGHLVRDAAFCHHCGKWLKAPADEALDEEAVESEVA